MYTSRQLAAVMFSDIEDFSALMQKDESKADEIREKYNTVLNQLHTEHGGRIVNFYGDGCLSIFNSVVEAVYCARDMQLQFRSNVPVRIGLHLGDIVLKENDVYGDGVNTASRIESLGIPGSVLLSDKVNDELRNHPEIKTISTGVYNLKNIERPIEVFALTGEGLIVPPAGTLKGKTAEKKNIDTAKPLLQKKLFRMVAALAILISLSAIAWIVFKPADKKNNIETFNRVAVLPFRNNSNDPANEYLSDGITEELTTTLSGISDLKVISRNSTQQYKNTNKSDEQIGKELNTQRLLGGSVIKEGNNIRINVQLINTLTDEILWNETFTKAADELLIFYSSIAQQVAHRMDVTIKDVERFKLSKAEKVNPELHQLYLKGLYYTNKFTIPDYKTAIGLYDQALNIEPDYTPALAGKALSYALMGVFNPAISTTEALPQTLLYATKAIAIDSSQSLGYMALGYARLFFQRNLSGADSMLQRVVKIDPSNDMAYTVLTLLNLYRGNTDSADYWLQKGKAISPFSFFLTHHEGRVLYLQNKKSEAFEAYKKAISVYEHPLPYDHLANLYNRSGMFEESITLLQTAQEKFHDLPASSQAWLAEAYFKSGDKIKAETIMKQMEEKALAGEPNYALFTAAYYACVNNKEKAFLFLDKAVAANDVDLLWLKEEPHFASLRNDSRYQAYLKKAGF
ncbi:MAG: hypothetical protein HYR66_10080 [Sphingobacteriales bacterium]|nr:hypothetical protein [Sphingobacteriales bacterium]MBI3720088.1 hypothetical protein [Sphingobacteriales bacterium]